MKHALGILVVTAILLGRTAPPALPAAKPAPISVEKAQEIVASVIAPVDTVVAATSSPIETTPRQAIRLPGSTVDFPRGGMRFVSRAGREPASFEYRLDTVMVGGVALYESRQERTRPVEVDGNFVYARGAVTEVYRAVGSDLEQLFVIHAKPPADGDLVVTGRTHTSLQPLDSAADEILLGRGGEPAIRIHEAVALDAAGQSQVIAMNFDGKALSLTVPADWLATARYPVVVDPLIGSTFALPANPRRLAANDTHYAAGGQFLAISWDGTPTCTGRLLSATDGSIIGSIPEFGLPTIVDDVAYLPSAGTYLATVVNATFDTIEGYIIDPSTNPVTVTSLGAIYSRAGIADTYIDVTCVAATADGWAIGFIGDVGTYTAGSIITTTAEVLKVDSSGAITSDGDPIVLREISFEWDIWDHWWYLIYPHASVVNAGGEERFAMVWSDTDAYNYDAGEWYYEVLVAGATLDTMTATASRSCDEMYVPDDGSVGYVNYANIAGDDLADEFLVTWDYYSSAGISSLRAERQTSLIASSGGTFFIRGDIDSAGPNYYSGDLVFVRTVSGGTPATADRYLIVFTNSVDAVYVEMASGTGSPTTETLVSADSAAWFACLNPADTRTLIVNADGVGRLHEMQSVPAPPLPPVITAATLPNATYNFAYSQGLSYVNGTSPNWTVSGGSLPGGLTLNAGTGVIDGTPTGPNGTINFTVQLTTSSGTDTQGFSITVVGAPGGGPPPGGGGGSGGGGGGGGCSAGARGGGLLLAFLALAMFVRRRG